MIGLLLFASLNLFVFSCHETALQAVGVTFLLLLTAQNTLQFIVVHAHNQGVAYIPILICHREVLRNLEAHGGLYLAVL